MTFKVGDRVCLKGSLVEFHIVASDEEVGIALKDHHGISYHDHDDIEKYPNDEDLSVILANSVIQLC